MQARLFPLLVTALVHAPSADAAPTPTINAVLGEAGVPLPDEVRDLAYCETSKRAVLWLASGEVVAVEASGSTSSIGMLPKPGYYPNQLVCDRQDRVIGVEATGLAILEQGKTRSVVLARRPAVIARLADDRLVLLDNGGQVSAWDGTTVTPLWSTRLRMMGFSTKFAPDGSALAIVGKDGITVIDKAGVHTGPRGMAVEWSGDAVLIASATLGLVRWRPTDPAETVTVVEANDRAVSMFRIGDRVGLVQGTRAVIRSIAGTGAPTELTRWPVGARLVAAAANGKLVVAGLRTAYLVDASRNGVVVPPDRPSIPVSDLVFSPDGKQLAVLDEGGVLVQDLATSKVRRLTYGKVPFAPKLFWDAAGLRAVFLNERVRWENGKPVSERLGERGLAIDERGEPVNRQGLCRQGLLYRSRRGVIAARCDGKVVVGVPGQPPSYTTPAHAQVFEIAGATPQLVYTEGARIMSASLDGTVRELGSVSGFVGSLVPDATGKRLAIVHGDTITIWDVSGSGPAVTLLSAQNPGGMLPRVAWSPDGRQLAVASRMAVAVWTLGLRS